MAYQKDIGEVVSSRSNIPHYYGDYVRRLFVFGALLILAILPFYPEVLPWAGVYGALFLAVVLVLCAGATSPLRASVAYLDLSLSLFGILFFEYVAVFRYSSDPLFLSLFRQFEAIIFAFAFYFSAKSLRGVR